MNDIMSYQYPPPGTPPPPYGYSVIPQMASMGMRSPNQAGRHETPTLAFDLKRASSHPSIKMDHDPEGSTMANAADKKRNTLGYQRATAACTNCRRRKIRCKPAEPPQDKCYTCSKLNKDCKFESVNADSPVESRHPSMSRASVGHRLASASSSSSPSISNGQSVDIHASQHHGPMPMPPIHHMGSSDSSGLKMDIGISRYSEYASQGMATNWMAPDSAAGSSSRRHGSWGTPYSHETTPMTPTFPSSYNSHSRHAAHQQQSSQASPTSQQSWASTGQPEANAAGWSSSYPPPTPSGFSPLTSTYIDRNAGNKTPISAAAMPVAEMYPPIPTMDHHGAPLSPPPPPPGSAQSASGPYGGWQQQHQAYPPIKHESAGYVKQESGGYPGSGGWYAAGPEAAHGQAGMSVSNGYYTQR